MASWMTYARKILSSIAGELEQTAQDFNDAFHSLSLPSANEATETDTSDSHESCKSSTLTTNPQIHSAIGAGLIPKHMRGLNSHSDEVTRPGPSIDPSSHRGHATATTSIPHLPTRVSEGTHQEYPSTFQHQSHRSSLSSTVTATTATICQPESLGVFSFPVHPPQSLHSRLSRSSPSLSPISHENCSGASSDVDDSLIEGLDYLASDICENDLVKMHTIRPRPVRSDQLRSLPFSMSTPCLVQVQKMLPSCTRKLNCASLTVPSRHTDKTSHRSKSSVPRFKGVSSISTFDGDRNTVHSFVSAEDKNLQIPSTGNYKKSSCSVSTKTPGKVVMVVSQSSSCLEANEIEEEKNNLKSGFAICHERNDPFNNVMHHQSLVPNGADAKSSYRINVKDVRIPQMSDNLDKSQTHPQEDEVHSQECSSASHQDQQVLRSARSTLKIERQVQQMHWRMLAPLARVLAFAYSQVVNAVLPIQNEEGSISSGNNRSRTNSFSREITAAQPILASRPVASNSFDTALSLAKSNAINKSSHKRQLSQLSLAGSALSSESFEVLDVSEMESSNFFYVGDDSSSGDVLHEYHLFPSKPLLSTQWFESHNSPTSDSGATLTTSFPPNSQEHNPMSSSSADFAHFNFGHLISNRHHNQLNPVTVDRDELASPEEEVLDLGINCASDVNDAMFESFVVLEGNEPLLDGISDRDESCQPSSGQNEKKCDQESQASHGSGTASFSVLSDCDLN